MKRLSATLLMAAALALAGCGYHPLYGSSATSPGVAGQLSAISIPEPSDRPSQLVRNELISTMQAGKGELKYLLNLTTTVANSGVFQKSLPAVTRNAITITTSYELVDRAKGVVMTSGSSFATVSYDVIRQPFADMQAEKDATERATREVAADLRTRLAAFLAKQPPNS